MDLFDEGFLSLWKALNHRKVKYILVGGFAINFHGFQRFTGDVDIYIDDSLRNRKLLRKAYKDYCGIDFEAFETISFIPGWVDFPLTNNMRLDIFTELKGVAAGFDDCMRLAKKMEIRNIIVPVLHINHLIANKKAVDRPKDQIDVVELEKIKNLQF